MSAGPGLRRLAAASRDELEALLRGGAAPTPEALAGFEFRGWNHPFFASVLGIRKFVKGFFLADGLEGYNIPVRQDGLAAPWTAKGKPFGFYRVVAADDRYPRSALLDYGASPRNAFYRPERVIRDYLVSVEPDLMLGKAYLQLGVRVFSNFFILERLRPTSWRP